jgi:hypothetical protein
MAIPFLHNINLDDNQLQNAKLHVTSSAPTAAKGQIYLDSTSNVDKLKYYDGTGCVVADATVSASYNTSDGVITFTTSSGDTYTVDIDGRYIESFTLQGDSGSTQTISNGDTVDIAGGTYVSTVAGATDTITINHNNTSRSDTTTSDSPGYGGSFDIVDSVTTNATGHVTSVNIETITLPAAEDYSWVLSADSGTNQTINDSNIVDVAGGTYISTVVSATDTVTINHDNTSRTNSNGTALTPDFGASVSVITGVTSNATGHVTDVETTSITIPQNDSVDVTSVTTGTFYPAFVTGTGDVAVNIDGGASDKLSYNAATQTLTVKNLVVPGTQTIQNETIQVVQDNTIRFEGSTADGFETDLTVVDPTADRTISLPDESGTVVLKAFKTVTADSGTDAVADSDTDTLTITGGNAISTVADATGDSITINHDDTSSQASVNNSGNNFIQDVTLDTYGHVTGLGSGSVAHTLSTSSSGTADSIDLDLGQPDGTDDIVVVTGGTGIDVTLNSSSQFTISATSSYNELAVDLDVTATEATITKSTNTYTVQHTLNSRDLIVQVYNTTTHDTVFVDVARPTTSTVTVAFASSVTDGDYRVLIKKIG